MSGTTGFDIVEAAPAKINLALHVTGRRDDGYHLLDTLVTFAAEGDRVSLRAASHDAFTLSGRFAHAIPSGAAAEQHNLVIRARDTLRRIAHGEGAGAPPVAIHLEKNLPPASGIGGGSADAAATLKGLIRLWRLDKATLPLDDAALSLGADVPMCLAGRPLLARGIGEAITPAAHFPVLHLVLVNPLVEVSTPAVFSALTQRDNPPLLDGAMPADAAGWLKLVATGRNDLEVAALSLRPEIGAVMGALEQAGGRSVRMSGSGATCFGLFTDGAAARRAGDTLATAFPDWFVMATETVRGA